jgi:hypothetical protein
VRLTCVFARDNLTSKPVYDDGRWRGHGGNNSGEGTPSTGYMDKRVSIDNICQLYSQYIWESRGNKCFSPHFYLVAVHTRQQLMWTQSDLGLSFQEFL